MLRTEAGTAAPPLLRNTPERLPFKNQLGCRQLWLCAANGEPFPCKARGTPLSGDDRSSATDEGDSHLNVGSKMHTMGNRQKSSPRTRPGGTGDTRNQSREEADQRVG
jgi:hypothetical protein